jgi:ferredoxin
MKIRNDKKMCIGDETCVEACPDLSEMEGDVAAAKMENVPKTLRRKLKKRQLPVLWKQSL